MKISIVRLYDTSKHIEGSAKLKQLFGRIVTFRVIFNSDTEEDTVLAVSAEVLAEESFELFRAQCLSRRSLVWLNVSRFCKLIAGAKEKGVPIKIEYPSEILVGYADSPDESHSEGTFYHDADLVTDLSEDGKKAILAMAVEISQL